MNERHVISSLENKYQQEFDLVSSNYIVGTNNYDVRVSLRNNPNLIFKVDYYPKTKKINDYYPYALWQLQADEKIRSFLDGFSKPYALRVAVAVSVKPDPLNIPNYPELAKDEPDKISVNIFLHLFGKENAETYTLLQKLDEYLRGKNLKKVGFTTSVYDETAIAGKNIKDLNFDFGIKSDETFESESKEHFLGLIKYRINPEEPSTPSFEELSNILQSEQNYMVFSSL